VDYSTTRDKKAAWGGGLYCICSEGGGGGGNNFEYCHCGGLAAGLKVRGRQGPPKITVGGERGEGVLSSIKGNMRKDRKWILNPLGGQGKLSMAARSALWGGVG